MTSLSRKWLIGSALLSLSACRGGPKEAGIRVGLITPGSASPTQPGTQARTRDSTWIHDSLGLAISHVEARTPAEQDEALRTYAAQGYDLVFAHGFEFQDAAERVSARVSRRPIFIMTSGRRAHGQVAPLIFRLEEASYLAGMVAGDAHPEQHARVRGRHRAAADQGGVRGVGERGDGGESAGASPARSTSTASTTQRPAGRRRSR